MQPDFLVKDLLEKGNGILLASAAVATGISRTQLSAMVKDGILERVDRGVYVRVGEIDDALFSMQQRAKKIVYSHETALFLHGLTDRTPIKYAVTVPNSYKPSKSIKDCCKVYYVKPELIGLGKSEMPSGMGHQIVAYDLERTICDVVRSRNRMDIQIFSQALMDYTARKDIDLIRLGNYARQFRVYEVLRQYLEVLL